MTVNELIVLLLKYPQSANVCIDVDDGMDRNYHEVTHVYERTNSISEPFIVIDADWGKSDDNTTR